MPRTVLTAVAVALCLGAATPRGASAQAEPDADALSLSTATEGFAPPTALAPAEPDAQAPSFPTAAEVVTVDVVVLDESGDPIEGLTADDFTITDEGRRRTLSRFEAVVVPESAPTSPPVSSLVSSNAEQGARPERTFVVVFDDVHMGPIAARAAKRAVRQFVDTMLRPGDRVTLVPGSGGAWWHARIPQGQRDLVAALERLEGLRPRDFSIGRISDWEAMRLYLHRDLQVGAQVTRRYYEYRILLDPPCIGGPCAVRKSTGETHPVVRGRAGEIYGIALARKRPPMRPFRRSPSLSR